jgi:transposase-like protein
MALTVKQAEAALQQTAGNVMAAARALGVSRSTLYRRINESASLQEVLTDAREELVDIAESALRREVLAGNITAIIFTLKTQGKSRGYVERTEVGGTDGGPVKFIVEYADSE